MLRPRGSESIESAGLDAQKKTKRFKKQAPEKIKAYLKKIALYQSEQFAYVDESGIDTY